MMYSATFLYACCYYLIYAWTEYDIDYMSILWNDNFFFLIELFDILSLHDNIKLGW